MKASVWTVLLTSLVAFGSFAHNFNSVDDGTFDPKDTDLVAARWIDGIGCPTGQKITTDGKTTTPFTDPACPTGDKGDRENAGLLLVKTGPTPNFAAAGADLKTVRGMKLTELGFDIRSGSHCGAGAPRFNVVTEDGVTHFVGCASGAVTTSSPGWRRLRFDPANPAQAFPPIAPTSTVRSISIIFDEGQDTGPDFSGSAIIDNIDVNGTLVGER
jgi:hypothetical protein